MSEIQFFSRIDRKGERADGAIVSQYPAWFLERQAEELTDNRNNLQNHLENGEIPPENIGAARAELRALKDKIDAIEDSRKGLNDPAVQDKVAKAYKEIGKSIADTMFTRTDMEKGLADAHEEARRMVSPVIQLAPEMMDVARSCNVSISADGRISRNDAEKIYKICGRAIGEDVNTERLRKDSRRG